MAIGTRIHTNYFSVVVNLFFLIRVIGEIRGSEFVANIQTFNSCEFV